MRTGCACGAIVVGSVVACAVAHADVLEVHADTDDAGATKRLEASAYFGLAYYGANTQLGNAWAPEQVPGTAPIAGVRVLGIVLPDLATVGGVRLALGVEGELGMAAAYTGGSFDGGRMQYFAPVFDWRAHVLVRAASLPYVHPHLLVGGGGETVASRSPFMAKETDGEVYWGLGATVSFGDRWMLRVDGRHGLMPGRDGIEQTFELQLGLGATFGLAHEHAIERRVVIDPPPVQPVVDDVTDRDGDGIPDTLDACPTEPETVNGVDDDDGCPDAAAPLVDPTLDTDGDGIPDVLDRCPDAAETRNGWADEDGCPDTVPDGVLIALATAQSITFEAGRARITDIAKEELAGVVTLLADHPDVELAIVVHAERAGAAAADLARRRADAIKWFLVDQGVVATRLDTPAGKVRTNVRLVPLVDVTLVPAPTVTTPR